MLYVFSFLQDFGLAVEEFSHSVSDCPPEFLNLTVRCCQVRCVLHLVIKSKYPLYKSFHIRINLILKLL